MKKIYLFIFLIVIGLSQNQSVKAKTSKVINTAGKTAALSYRAGATAKVTMANTRLSKRFGANPAITFAALGTKQFTNTDLTIVASSTAVGVPPITYTSSNPNVATIVTLLTFGAPNGGTGYVNGTYNNVPLTGGSGSGALVQIIVVNNVVTSVTPAVSASNAIFPALISGSGYVAGDVLTCAAGFIGGSGTGFSIPVATVIPQIHFVSAPAAPNNTTVITASQGGGTAGNGTLPADVPNVLTVTAPSITFPTLGTKAYSSQDIPVGASSTVGSKIITYTSSNPAVATINNTVTGVIVGGTGYTGATYYKVPLIGGNGTGATATITTSSSAVSAVTITANGPTPYAIGDVLTAASSNLGGPGSGFTYTVTGYSSTIHYNNAVPAAPNNTTVITASQGGGASGLSGGYITNISSLTGGSSYTNGTYSAVPLTGGSGTGATATVVVSGGAVTSVVVANGGSGYTINNTLSCTAASIGGTGSGFNLIVANTGALPADASQTLTVTQPAINFPPLGTKQFTSTDLNPGATGSTFTTGSISAFGTPTPGTGYTNGTYYSVPLIYVNSTTVNNGSGATATITVIGGVITSVVATSTGINYQVGDILTALTSNIGGTGSGFNIQVSSLATGYPVTYTSSNLAVATIVNNYIHYVGAGTTNITASQNGPAGASTGNVALPTPAIQSLTVTAPTITFPLTATKPLSNTDINPGATSTITTIPITYTSSNTGVAIINNNGVSSTNTLVQGLNYTTAGYYTNVPLTGSATGSGAKATIIVLPISSVVVSGVVVSQVNGVLGVSITSSGSGYAVGDVLTCAASSIGGGGTGFSVKVATISSYIHFIAAGTTNITASQGGGSTGTNSLPADVVQAFTVTPPVITFPALGNALLSTTDLNPGATSTLTGTPITYTITPASAVGTVATVLTNSITSSITQSSGSGYTNGTYAPVPLTGGSGTGATAQILVVGGSVTGVTIISGGTGYKQYDLLSCATANIGGTTGAGGFTAVVTNIGGAIHFIGAPAAPANSITITASQGGGAGSNTLPADVSQPLKVLPYTITFPGAFGSQQLNSTDLAPGATSTLSTTTVPITYSSDNTAVATIVSGNIHFVGTGTANITASQGGGATGTPTLPADVKQAITVTAPTITFPALAPVFTTNATDISPNATSSITTPAITYTSDNLAVATIVAGNIRTMGGAGTANIKASQGGGTNGTANLPADASQPLKVTAAAITMPPPGTAGTVVYTDVDFSPGATSPANVPITYTSSNPAVATIKTSVAFASPINGGSGYTNGTYTSVPLLVNGTSAGPGTIIVSGGMVTSVIPNAGVNIASGAVVTTASSNIGGSGSGFNATVSGTVSLIHLNPAVPAAPNNTTTITASQGLGGAASATQVLTVTPPVLKFTAVFGTAGTVPSSNLDINPNATSTVVNIPIVYTSSNPAVATIVNGQIHIIGAGATTIEATQQNSPVGTVAPAVPGIPGDVTQGLTVSNPAITFNAVSASYATTDLPLTATSTYTLIPITYTIPVADQGVATIVGGNVHFMSTGTAHITASQGGGASGTVTIPKDVTVLLTVNAPAITVTAIGSKQLTDVDLPLTATSTVTNTPITYSSDNTAVATIVNGNVHYVGQGNANITASQGGGTAGTNTLPKDVTPAPVSPLTSNLVVTAPVITFATIGSKPYSPIDLALTATSTITGIPITYTSSNTAIATIVNNSVHFIGNATGAVNITASQGGGSAGTATLPKDVVSVLTVTIPAITFAAPGTKQFSTTDFALTATTSTLTLEAAPITYTSSNLAVATIVNGAIHYVGIGNANITASQGGGTAGSNTLPKDVTPPPVSPAITNLVVTQAITTFAPALNSKVINSGDVTLAATSTVSTTTYPPVYTTSDATVAVILPGNILHYIGLGTCTVTATQIIPGNPTWAPAPATVPLTVTAAAAPVANTTVYKIAFPVLGTLGSTVFSTTADLVPAATSTGPQTITYTSSNPAVATILNGNIHLTPPSIVNGVVTYPNPDVTTITASQGGGVGGVTGVVAADVSQTLTVTAASIAFTLSPNSLPFGTDDLAPGATSTFQVLSPNNTILPITYTSSNPAVATIVNNNIHYIGLGSTTITASLGNVIVPNVSQNLLVTAPVLTFPATRSVVFSTVDAPNNATSTVGTTPTGAPLPINYTSSNPAVVSIVNGNLHFNNAGTVTITASQAAYNSSIPAPANATQVLTVTGGGTLSFPLTRTQVFTLTDQDPGATSTITTAPITYTSNNPALVSVVNGKLHFNLVQPPATVGNSAVITASQAATTGVPAQAIEQVLTVTPAIIVQNPLTKFYGDPDFSPAVSSIGYPINYSSATTTVATIVGNPSGAGQLVHIIAPGTSILSATQLVDAANSTAPAAAPCTLTVVAAPMIITPKNVTAVYGTPLITLPMKYDGFKITTNTTTGALTVDDSTKFTTQPIVNILGKTPNGSFGTIPVGTYTLTASGAVSTLYTFSYGTGTLTILPAVQTLTWTTWNGTHAIGDADFDPLARSTGDPIGYTSSNTAVATISGISTLAAPIGGSAYANGTYTAVPLTGGGGSGALATIVVANGAITTVTITTAGSNYAIGNVLTASATSIGGTGSGFSVKVNTVVSLLHIVGVGTSTITANLVPISGNYTGTGTLTNTLTVGPGAQTITVATIPYLNRGSAAYTPNATASSGLPVTITSSDPTLVQVVGQTIIPLHVGSTTITFTQAGNANYLPATSVVQFVQIVDPSGNIVKVDQAVSPNGDGINDFLYVEGLQNYPVNHVKIINRNGDVVYEADGYNNKDVAFSGKSSHNGKLLPADTYFYLIDYNTGGDKNHITGYFVLKY